MWRMKRHVAVSGVVVLWAVLVLSFGPAATAASKTIELKLAGSTALGTPTTLAGFKFAELVKEKSGGELVVKYYPASQLGGSLAHVEAVRSGAVDMAQEVMEWYARFVKDWNIMALGFAFRDEAHLRKFLESDINAQIEQELVDKWGMRVIGRNWFKAPRVLLCRKPVRAVDDLKGIKIRVPDIEMYVKTWQALGASPTMVAWGETYMALRQGVVDACESPFDSVYGMKFHEAAPYIMRTNHLISAMCIVINDRKFQSLPAHLRSVLVESAAEAGEYHNSLVKTKLEEDIAKMKAEGATVIDVDLSRFQEKVKTIVPGLEAAGYWKPGLYSKIQEM